MSNFDKALAIVQGDDRTYAAYQKLTQLGESSSGDEAQQIGDLIESFIVDGGETLEPDSLAQ